jgi:fumarylpyruvate hydrolase
MSLVFPSIPPITLPILGTANRFPVHRVYCVGRNYNDHVKEMGGVVGRDPPFFFAKPPGALVSNGQFPYPNRSTDVHHELELVVALGVDATIFGHAIGIDMTRRDLQAEAKRLGRPWETAKSFDHSAPISAIVPIEKTGPLTGANMTLDVNGQRRQTGNSADMIWNVAEIIAELQTYFQLQAGDIIFTGTPAGVGPVLRGDTLTASITGLGTLLVDVT